MAITISPRALTLWAVCLVTGCHATTVNLTKRPCKAGACAKGYVCNPDTNQCVPPVTIGCGNTVGFCPSSTRTGDACPSPGSFLPCQDGVTNCSAGCRTCQADGTWSACSAGECTLGELWSCSSCSDDCTQSVKNATPICNTSGAVPHCDYTGVCTVGTFDADGNRANGCECLPTNGGVEICDGKDNDCNGIIDDGDLCGSGSTCDGGHCVPCTATDPRHCGTACVVCDPTTPTCAAGVCQCTATSCSAGSYCGPSGSCVSCSDSDPNGCGTSCAVCSGATPTCTAGQCVCTASSCPAGQYCSADGSCQVCADTDPNHCGQNCTVCSSTQPVCSGGACQCTDTSCGASALCNTNTGQCAACNTAAHCGPSCAACSLTSDRCVSGVCECVQGSCPSGQYCNGGACQACSCSGRFSTCVDTGGGFTCQCSASSCGAGAVCSTDGTTCSYTDNFDAGGGMLSKCAPVTNSQPSTWQQGVVVNTPGFACYSGSCWGTNLDGNTNNGDYNYCEFSCVASGTYDTSQANEIVLSFEAKYELEYSYVIGSSGPAWDGVTVQFIDDTSSWSSSITPDAGWDTDHVALGGYCRWTAPDWPVFGQYKVGNNNPTGWTQERFVIDRAAHPELFWSGFRWRIVLLSDSGGEAPGFYIDNMKLDMIY